MATNNVCSDLPPFLCLLCLKDCKQPRELPCYHYFCLMCIDKYIRSEHVVNQEKTYFPCPVCDHPTVAKDPMAPASKWATFLPANAPFHPPDTKGLGSGGMTFCDACLREDQKVKAHVWCKDCMEAICKVCSDAHRKNKMSSSHTAIPWDVYVRTSYTPVISVKETCPEHDGNRLELFCLDHNSLCCTMCITLSHRSCQRYKSMDSIVTKTPFYPQQAEWNNMKEGARKLIDVEESNIKKLEKKKSALLKTMSANVRRSKDKLDQLFTRFQDDVDYIYTLQSKTISRQEQVLKEFQTNVENCCHLMTLLNTHGSRNQKFIGREQTKSQLSSHFRRLHHKVKDVHNEVDLILRVNDGLDQIMNTVTSLGVIDTSTSISSASKDTLTNIGTLIDTLNESSLSQSLADSWKSSDTSSAVQQGVTVSSPTSPTSPTKSVDVLTANLTLVKSVSSLSLGGGYKVHLSGGVFVEGDGLILADCKNNRLMLFNETYDYINNFVLDGHPIDVTRGCTAKEVLVAMHLNKEILRCTLQGGVLTIVNKIIVPEFTYGIAVLGTSILTGTFNDVKLLTTEGRELKSVPKVGDCAYVAASNSQRTFCHRDGNAIVCRAQDGTESFRYVCRSLREPRGIGLDRDGNIYVCVYQGGSIQQISWEGSRTRVILPSLEGITKPCAIVVNPSGHQLLVTSQKENVAFVVYKFDSN